MLLNMKTAHGVIQTVMHISADGSWQKHVKKYSKVSVMEGNEGSA